MKEANGNGVAPSSVNGVNGASVIERDSGSATSSDAKNKADKPKLEQATFGETMAFAFDCGGSTKVLFCVGFAAAVLNGLVYPMLAYLFSSSFSDISSAQNNGLAQVRKLAYTFMIVGTYALVVATIQGWTFEIVAYRATQNFRMQWFKALLRQDTAYFDVYNVGGIANQVGPNANKFRRGLGRKFGEGIQFLTTGVGGIGFAFYMSWRVAFVVLAVLPFVSLSALMVLQLNQTKGARAASAYRSAGSIAYSAVSAIKTVLSLNGVQTMIDKYAEATRDAYQQATSILLKQGFANGAFFSL
jgi:ATP-binding cassette, subfamily B (MDR/TAP), member 1